MRALGRIWLAGGALVAVLVVAFGWFILAMPQLDQASQADLEQASVQAQNAELQAVLAKMKGQYENLEELEAQLGELQLSVPGTRDLDAYFLEVALAANLAGVVLNGVEVDVAQPYSGTAIAPPPEPEPTPSETASADGGNSETTTPSTTVPGSTSPQQSALEPPLLPSAGLQSNLFVLPVSIKITADLGQATSFLDLLQSNDKGRLMLLNGVKLTLGSSLNGELTGFIFVVHDPSKGPLGALPTPTPTPDPASTADPSAEPEPSTEPETSTEPDPSTTPVPAN